MALDATNETLKLRTNPRLSKTSEFRCTFCPGHAFRRSRLRFRDLSALLMLRYPVRCLRCSQRQLVSFNLASISVPAHVKHQRLPTEAESWKSWTAGEEGKSRNPNVPSPAAPSYSQVDTGPRFRRKPGKEPGTVRDGSRDIW